MSWHTDEIHDEDVMDVKFVFRKAGNPGPQYLPDNIDERYGFYPRVAYPYFGWG